MRTRQRAETLLILLMGVVAAIGIVTRETHAHCDTLDGPVVTDARQALTEKNVEIVLKWVHPADEAEIQDAFERALAVRTAGGATRELADQFFFETVVRIHRSGEGAAFTGLKPAGSPVDAGIRAADNAIALGSDSELIDEITKAITKSVHHRFTKVMESKKHENESVAAGRAYVDAYVDYVHFVAALDQIANRQTSVHSEHAVPEAEAHHVE